MEPRETDVLILCGGKGTRLKGLIFDRPKALAPIKQTPFLDILIKYVSGFGFRRFILCTGHMSGCIKRHYKRRNTDAEVVFSEERSPLGTGGAVLNAKSLIKSRHFLIINGDCLIKANLRKFLDFHIKEGSLVSMILATSSGKCQEYGNVLLHKQSHIICDYKEKSKYSKSKFTSSGFYIFDKAAFSLMPKRKEFSLEYDFFPKLIGKKFYGYICKGNFTDIGTPERFKRSQGGFLSKILGENK